MVGALLGYYEGYTSHGGCSLEVFLMANPKLLGAGSPVMGLGAGIYGGVFSSIPSSARFCLCR